MITVYLIRHGATAGNLERRYIGCNDEPLCAVGVEQANALKKMMPPCDVVFASPMTRTLQTAGIVFPDKQPIVQDGLRECDFGAFTGKNSDDMRDDPAYTAWVDANCATCVPGGEDPTAFKERCVTALVSALTTLPDNSVAAFVTHAGAIMSILDHFSKESQGFFSYHPGNCGCVHCVWENGTLTAI